MADDYIIEVINPFAAADEPVKKTWYAHIHDRARAIRAVRKAAGANKHVTVDVVRTEQHVILLRGEALIWLARVSNRVISYGWFDDPSADLQEGLQAALRAIYLDEKNPYAHYALAMASIFSSAEQAILPAEKVIELSPGFALGHFALGLAQLSSGRASDAIGPFQRGLKLSPHDPRTLRGSICWQRRSSLRVTRKAPC